MATASTSRRRAVKRTSRQAEQRKLNQAEEFYQRRLKAKLERTHRGQVVAIDPDTHEYFVARDGVAALKLIYQKYPGKSLYLRGIGYLTRIGPRGIKRRR
jgi:hypothetical protein